ncbi:MAG: hypothetical protein LC115_08305 [Bacteroidia bacterium]|nr:hypothetical protein [Chitinophagaceae bacterium]MCZ2356674.1 hypothetical protein [Bacteroidia bacterium]
MQIKERFQKYKFFRYRPDEKDSIFCGVKNPLNVIGIFFKPGLLALQLSDTGDFLAAQSPEIAIREVPFEDVREEVEKSPYMERVRREEYENKTMKIIINLSNHPSSSWSEAQKAGWDVIDDIQFPAVEFETDIKGEAVRIVGEIVDKYRCEDYRMITVMVQGQSVLTFAIVLRLLRLGFRVVAAYTERNTTVNPDGTKTVKFDFGGWQDYSL